MPKKLLFIVMVGVLVLSACTAKATPTPTATEPATTETAVLTQDATSITNIDLNGLMPCRTVFDYDTTAETDQYQAVVDQLPAVSDSDWVRGDADAPITIVEYADFQCPACGNFALYLEALQDAFPGDIKVVFRDMPLPSIHDKAYIASMAGKAAGAQGMFWEMYDILYHNQSTWSSYTEEEFVTWVTDQADTLGLDLAQFQTDMNDEAVRAKLEEETIAHLNMGLQYTPFVIVNGRIFRDNHPDIFALIGIYQYNGYEECPPWVINPDASYTAKLDTNVGEIVIDLNPKAAPMAVNSFVFLAQNGWYDGVYFHRVLDGFVAQAGDPSGYGVISPGYNFATEIDSSLSFDKAGVVGMANSGEDQNGSQFFITLGPTTDLDGGYTIFGQVQEDSMPVLDQIALRDPQTAVDFTGATVINSIEIIEN